ncbi:MAG TPA: prepilin-type N-terminal cleavage/methylation domain-containing protein [Chthoniobacteraceae bacterium]|nr:prepilin-type N-terminal cleavage/methylation domain-containing protein [Chthoniobacteraceae bacterium]
MFARRENSAFTLLELLVVCVTVAILAGVAIPAISGGFMAANRTKCASNMRQIGAAILLHAAEHNGALPVTSHSTGDSRFKINGQWVNTIEYSWIYVLADYLSNVDEVRVCPADEKERRKRIRELNATSYLLNDVVFDSQEYRRLLQIPSPSRTAIMFISNRPVSRTWDHAHCAQWTTWPALCEDMAPDRHRVGARAPDRLNGSANVLFADGHVQNLSAKEMKQKLDSGEKPWLPGR